MGFKAFFKSKSTQFVVWNILLAILIVVILLTILFFWLRHYTQHGVEVEVPNVVGLYMEEAQPQVTAVGMTIEVVDSTYSNDAPLGTIVEQMPPAFSHAKHNRTMYVVMNARNRRQVALPDLHDMSYRQAETTLRSVGIRVSDEYEYEPSEYKDLVLDVKKDGRALAPGERIDEGSLVTLVVGFGKGTEMVEVPTVIGMTLTNARSLLLSKRLTVGTVEYDEPEPEKQAEAVVYFQSPNQGEQLLEGSMVNLKLSVDVEKALTSHSQESEEEFF